MAGLCNQLNATFFKWMPEAKQKRIFPKKYLLTLVFLLLSVCSCPAQQAPLKFTYLTVDDGLSHTDVKDITQDRLGFIWIATLFGLDRFDGHQVKRFYNTTVPKDYAFKNRIRSMCLDESGKIWLGSEDGIQFFNPVTEKYTNVQNRPHNTGKRNYTRLIALKGGYLATLAENQLRLFKVNGSELKDVTLNYPSNTAFTDMVSNEKGEVWLTSNTGLWLLNKSFHFISQRNGAISGALLKVSLNTQGRILVVKGTSIFLTGISAGGGAPDKNYDVTMPTVNIPRCSVINDIVQDKKSNYWVGTDAGLFLLDSTLAIRQVITPGSFVNSINSNFVNKLFIDRSECLWVCSFGGGLNYCDLNEKLFYAFQRNPESRNTLSGNHTRALLEESENILWIGTNSNGLNRYDFKNNTFTYFNTNYSEPRLRSNEIDALELDDDRNLWIASDKGLEVLDRARRRILKLPGSQSFPAHSVSCLARDCFGNIWFGSYYNGFGIIRRDQSGSYQVSYKGNNSGYYIFADKKEPEILVSSIYGLVRLRIDREGNVLQRYHYGVNNTANSLSSDYTFPIRKATGNAFWVGTIGGGLNYLRLGFNGSYTLSIYDQKFGVFNDVEAMEVDDKGNVWMGGNGLERLDVATKKLTRFDKNDGLQGNSFKVGASFKGAKGRLYFGGINGVNYFNPDSIKVNAVSARPTFTDLIINNKPVSTGTGKGDTIPVAIPYTRKVVLDYRQNNFVISFSSMHYANPAKCQYRYKLAGFDKEWNYTTGKTPSASYTNLDYQDYELLLEASNNDGIWAGSQARIGIAVIAPWWKSGIAKWAYALLIISAVAGVYVYQARWFRLKNALAVRDVEERKREEMHGQREALYKQQIQFFANISHEFRTPLTLILGPLEALLAETAGKHFHNSLELMHRNAKRLINLINELMNFRKVADKAVSLEVEQINAKELVYQLYDEFKQLAVQRDMDFLLNAPPGDLFVWLDRQVIEKIMFNLLNNAFKYTSAKGKVELELILNLNDFKPTYGQGFKLINTYRADDYIYFRVADTGVGISEESISHIFDRYYRVNNSHIGSGIGLALVKSLVELHRGDILVYSERNKGTEIIVGFPCKAETYRNRMTGELPGEGPGARLELTDNAAFLADLPVVTEKTERIADTAKPLYHILIVEDNHELRHFLGDVLEKNYKVYEAPDGHAGFNMALANNPDLIISDVMMPNMNGVELCRQIRATFETSHIPFLFLSAKDALEAQLEGMESGADFYIAKPVSIELLKLTISNLFEQKQKLKQKYTGDYYAEASELTHSEKDREFIDKLIKLIEDNMHDTALDVDFICDKMFTSRSKLYKKIKAISGQSINEFVRTVRLKKAAYIMTNEDITQNELVDRIGIQSVSYFQKAFRKEFGNSPSQFLKSIDKNLPDV